MKRSHLALLAGVCAATAAAVTSLPAEARSTEQAIKNRLDPNRITSRHVHRHDYAHRRYRWSDHDDYRYRRYAGWYRYDDRPYGWRSRQCVGVGPVWFCP